MSSRLVFDTSVYIAILRDGRFAASFRERYRRDVPRTHMCSVIVQELLAGARTAHHRKLAAALYEPFERARRIVVPTHRVWKHAGMVLSMLWNRLPAVRSRVARGLVNDALIALTARSIGAAVVTPRPRARRRGRRARAPGRDRRERHPFAGARPVGARRLLGAIRGNNSGPRISLGFFQGGLGRGGSRPMRCHRNAGTRSGSKAVWTCLAEVSKLMTLSFTLDADPGMRRPRWAGPVRC